jgi:site-specific recombinase XerD
MKDMGIHITAHQLRHAYASYILYDSNIDVKTAQKLLGHSDVETTMNIYTHLTNMRLNSGFDQINNHVLNNPFGCQNVVKIDTTQ